MRLLPALLALILTSPALKADEGMWTFDNLPLAQLKAKYGFAPDQAWLDHLRLASVRFPEGSGAFVSLDGLVLTNHHVAHSAIEQVSSQDKDYVKHGFVALNREQELKIPGMALFTLVSMENVTAAIEGQVAKGLDEKAAGRVRSEVMARLLEADKARTGLDCQPVILYQGGQRWIYRYQKHTDVRLVMAPEYQIAAFGMDWDNFSFPRHDLDFALFRVYADGKPYTPPHFLAWSQEGAALGALTFTSGNPGKTSRLQTVAQMAYDRDLGLALQVRLLERDQKAMRAFAALGEEQARLVSDRLQYDGNFIKVFKGQLQGLQDPTAFSKVRQAESELRGRLAQDARQKAFAGPSWGKIAEAMERKKKMAKPLVLASTLAGPRGSQYLTVALNLVRLGTETPKPAGQRLAEYASEEALKAAKGRVEAFPPVNPELESAVLLAVYRGLLEELGASHALVKEVLLGRSPEDAVRQALAGTRLGDLPVRTQLLEGGFKGVAESRDTFIQLARRLDPILRELRKQSESIQAVVGEHGARIATARFKAYGTATYPDATFTLRLSYGAVETMEAGGTLLQPFTTFGGLFDRADAWGPKAEEGSWDLPARWRAKRGALNPSTPYNYLTTNDIIGGNSGSPVVDRKGELIGLAFDGNIESLPGGYYYDGRVNRMIALDTRAIAEALDKVYEAGHLVSELKGQ